MPQELTFREQIKRELSSRQKKLTFREQIEQELSRRPPGLYQRQQAAERQTELQHARKELEESLIPSFKAFGVAAGAPIVALGARVIGKGEYADRMIRHASAIEQAAREREEGGFPDIIQRGIRGAGASLTTMVPAAAVAGPYGAIAVASAQEANSAITEGRNAGKKGMDLAGYAVSQGVIEGIPAAIMQKIGLGGVESLVSKRAVSTGVKQGLRQLGITTAQELPEELVTEISHSIAAKLAGVDEAALTSENLSNVVKDTTVQTLITVGFAGAPSVARSVKAGKVAQTTSEIESYVKENKVPSRKTWKKWGLAPEMGETRKQRRAFIREVSEQVQAQEIPVEPPTEVVPEAEVAPEVAPEVPEAAMGPPAAAVEAVVGPEVSEVAPVAEAVQEAPSEAEADPTVALNKVEGAKIREDLGLFNLGEEVAQTFDSVANDVAVSKADEKALDVAEEVFRTERQITTHEHVAMVLKAGKLLNDLDASRAIQASAATDGNQAAHEQAVIREGVIVEQLDKLTMAARYSRREIARALSIGRLRLSRENFDVVNVMERMQAIKGPKGELTVDERKLVARLTSEHATLVEDVERVEQEGRDAEEARDAALAEKVMAVNKPRKKIGRGIRERAVVEREDIKQQIRQMGLRVNDITGIAPEGVYLIGRLGITYIKEGAGTLIEVAERLREDMPDLNLSQHDVNQALIARSPKEKIKARSEAIKRVAKLKSMARRFVKLDALAQSILGEVVTRPVESQEQLRLRKMQANLEKRLKAEEKLEAARQGEFPKAKKGPVDSPVITAIKAEIRELQKLDRATKKTEAARRGKFPEKIERKPTSEKIKRLQGEFTALRNEFYASDIDAAKFERAIETVNRLQDQLKNGREKIEREPTVVPPELAAVNDQIRQLRMELRVDEELAKVNEQLQTGEYVIPVKRVKKPVNQKLARKQTELTQKRREITQLISDTAPWTIGKVVKEVAFSAKAIAATADFSFTLRQNLWQVASHPIRASKAFLPSLQAFLSENKADEINNALLNSDNAFLYEQSGLAILDANSPDAQDRSEVYRGRVIERAKILGKQNPFGVLMSASARHAAVISNLIRTSAFDQFITDFPNATNEEMRAYADYLNVSTGLGNLGSFGAIGDKLQLVFFSPKFAVSRIQTPYKLYRYWNLPRVRSQIANDMVSVAATGIAVLTLAHLAGFSVELLDPEDPDWGKIRVGNMRIDIWGGFQQPTRLIARLATGKVFGEDTDPLELLGRFAAFKLSPAVTIPIEILRGETAVGEEVVAPEWVRGTARFIAGETIGDPAAEVTTTLARSVMPLVARDVHEAWEQHGVPGAVSAAVLAGLGVGVSVYEDSESGTRREIKQLKRRKKFAEAEKLRLLWNRKNQDNKISKEWFMKAK